MKKLGLIYGGMSTENEISKLSAKSIIKNLDKTKYEIYSIYISQEGVWNKYIEKEKKYEKIINIIEYIQDMDVIFPVLHGLYGEDGTIQGLLELLKKPYVGCGVLSSSIGMDKVYSKLMFKQASLNQAKYEYIKKDKDTYIIIDQKFNEEKIQLKDVVNKINKNIHFPMFVKPSNSGSSVGITKVNNSKELENAIIVAGKYDNKILIEEGIVGREVECAVLGNNHVIASCIGEVKPSEEFYSYDAKYNSEGSKTIIPARIKKEISDEIRKQAIKAFKAIDGSGLSRVDFFIEKGSNKIFINEINTLPGFTNISMYPQLFKESGIDYSDLLDRMINLALEK